MLRILIVFAGGGVGSAVRYLLGARIQSAVGPTFPVGTLTINITGSLLLALLMGLSLRTTNALNPELRLLLTTGFCGGYTTYSTFNYEALTLAREGAWGLVILYVLATVIGGLLAGALGLWLARATA